MAHAFRKLVIDEERVITRRRMTEAEYLEYDLTHPGKHEYFDGELVDMAGASLAHGLVASNLQGLLFNALRRGPCRVIGSDMRVRIDETGSYAYPDLTVVCGRAELAATQPESLLDPTLIVEVLSASTAGYDVGEKSEHYRRLPTVRAVLFADSRKCALTLLVRNPDGSWRLSDHTTGAVRIPGADVELHLDEIYERVEEAWAREAESTGPPPER